MDDKTDRSAPPQPCGGGGGGGGVMSAMPPAAKATSSIRPLLAGGTRAARGRPVGEECAQCSSWGGLVRWRGQPRRPVRWRGGHARRPERWRNSTRPLHKPCRPFRSAPSPPPVAPPHKHIALLVGTVRSPPSHHNPHPRPGQRSCAPPIKDVTVEWGGRRRGWERRPPLASCGQGCRRGRPNWTATVVGTARRVARARVRHERTSPTYQPMRHQAKSCGPPMTQWGHARAPLGARSPPQIARVCAQGSRARAATVRPRKGPCTHAFAFAKKRMEMPPRTLCSLVAQPSSRPQSWQASARRCIFHSSQSTRSDPTKRNTEYNCKSLPGRGCGDTARKARVPLRIWGAGKTRHQAPRRMATAGGGP